MEQRSNYVGSKGVQVKLDGEEECARAILGYAQMRHYSCHHSRDHLSLLDCACVQESAERRATS